MILPLAANENTLVEYYRHLYKSHGENAFSVKYLEEHDETSFVSRVQYCKLNLRKLSIQLGKQNEFDAFRKLQRHNISFKWTDTKIVDTANNLIKEHGRIPTADWLKENQLAGFIAAVCRKYETMNKFRETFADVTDSKMLCRGGRLHDSFPETCVANFLFSRGINYDRGRHYPEEYEKLSGKKYGRYDLEFRATTGEFQGQLILTEIYGNANENCGPGGSEEYIKVRRFKEEFNKDNPCFIGLEYKDCYNENRLTKLFEPFIGRIEKIRFAKDTDRQFDAVGWTCVDEVIKECKEICLHMPGGVLPPCEWMLRNGPYKNRKIAEWEKASYGSLFSKMMQVGGIKRVREHLGQEQHNAVTWTKEKVITESIEFYKKNNDWPQAFVQIAAKSTEHTTEMIVANRLAVAARNQFESLLDYKKAVAKRFNKVKLDIRKLPIGVYQNNHNLKYVASISRHGKVMNLGTFSTVEEAADARRFAQSQYKDEKRLTKELLAALPGMC